MYWPSFNGVLGSPTAQHRVAINTYLALACSCLSACWIAKLKTGKLEIEILLNATLAGGVALGASADLITKPYGAMLLGIVIGIISALGYAYFTPVARGKLGLHDTCGVLYLHCIPGIVGGFVSAMVVDNMDEGFGLNYGNYVSDARTPRT